MICHVMSCHCVMTWHDMSCHGAARRAGGWGECILDNCLTNIKSGVFLASLICLNEDKPYFEYTQTLIKFLFHFLWDY